VRGLLCPTVIGRDRELRELNGAIRNAMAARGSATFLLGEAGIGKSRLVREAIATARGLGLPVLLGRATQSSGTVAFRPLSEALLSYFRDQDLPEPAELTPFRNSLARLLPQWRRGEFSAIDESIVVLAEAIVRLLRAVGRGRGCLLILEDVHWADPETLTIVEYLCGNLTSEPMLLVCTVRSELSNPAVDLVDVLAARRAVSVAQLRRLTPADTGAMARACLATADVPESVKALLAESADGVPFFVEELLAGAVQAGALVDDGAGWTVAGHLEPQVPRTFADSVEHRLASLGDAARILVTAAVLGRRFDWTLLCDVSGESAEVVLDALRAGVDAQLLVADPTRLGAVQFRHALTRDAVLRRLLPAQWSELAQRALDAIAGAHPDLPGEWCDLAARLAERAGDGRATELLIESGRRSLARGALTSAEGAFEHARQVADDRVSEADAMDALCEAFALAGKVDPALELGDVLVNALRALSGPPRRVGAVHARLAGVAAAATRWAVADRHLILARGFAEEAADPGLSARVDVIAAQIAYGRGDLEQAGALARSVLSEAERLGLPELVCEALLQIGHCARTTGVDRAEQAYLEAGSVAARHGLELLRVRALFEVGTIDFMTMRPPHHLNQARELAASTGALETVAQIDMHLGAWFCYHFDNEQAIAACGRASEAGRRLHLSGLLGISVIGEAAAHGRLGRRDRMQSLVDEAMAAAGDDVAVAGLMWGLCRAELSLIDENRQRALRELDTMMDLLRTNPASPPMPPRGLWALVCAVEDRDGEAACAEVRASGAAAQSLTHGFVHYAEAVLAGRAGRHEAAWTSFAAGDEALENLTWYRHFSHRLVAEAAIADGWGEPAAWLGPALAQFEEHGQQRLVAACRSMLGKAGAPVPRRRANSGVPLVLRERGVTEREAEVLALLGDGLSNKEIASRLFLSPRTVERHIANLTAKTDLRTRSELVAFAARTGRG
jgi:DNA-binding CsgD family transcriptional regulator